MRIRKCLSIFKYLMKEFILYINNQKSIERSALLLCHSLEKGMGIEKIKPRFGEKKAEELIGLLSELNDKNGYAYKESCAVLNEYFAFKNKMNEDVEELEKKFLEIKAKIDSSYEAGYDLLSKDDLMQGTKCNFEKLVNSKHSVRKYSKEKVTEEEVLKAIELSSKAPSACNRQPWKVYYTLNTKKNEELSKLVPGNKAFESDIPYYCVVTIDRKMFGSDEIFQWYINGGIFLTYLTLSFHSLGIGTCIFQFPQIYKTMEKRIKELLQIGKSEVIIAFLGYGKYTDNTKCIKAYRKNKKYIASKV